MQIVAERLTSALMRSCIKSDDLALPGIVKANVYLAPRLHPSSPSTLFMVAQPNHHNIKTLAASLRLNKPLAPFSHVQSRGVFCDYLCTAHQWSCVHLTQDIPVAPPRIHRDFTRSFNKISAHSGHESVRCPGQFICE